MLERQKRPEGEELGSVPPWCLEVTIPWEGQSLQIRRSQPLSLSPPFFPQTQEPCSLLVLLLPLWPLPSLLQRLHFSSLFFEGRCSPKLSLGFLFPYICFQMNLHRQSSDCTLSQSKTFSDSPLPMNKVLGLSMAFKTSWPGLLLPHPSSFHPELS